MEINFGDLNYHLVAGAMVDNIKFTVKSTAVEQTVQICF
jgi:hypothetical protein